MVMAEIHEIGTAPELGYVELYFLDDLCHINGDFIGGDGEFNVTIRNGDYAVVNTATSELNAISCRESHGSLAGFNVVPLIFSGGGEECIDSCTCGSCEYIACLEADLVYAVLSGNDRTGRILDLNAKRDVLSIECRKNSYADLALDKLGLVFAGGGEICFVGILAAICNNVFNGEGCAARNENAVLIPFNLCERLTGDGAFGVDGYGYFVCISIIDKGVLLICFVPRDVCFNDHGNGVIKLSFKHDIVCGHYRNGCSAFIEPSLNCSSLILGEICKYCNVCALGKKNGAVLFTVYHISDLGYAGNADVDIKACVYGAEINKTHKEEDLGFKIGEFVDSENLELIPIDCDACVNAEDAVAVVEDINSVHILKLIGHKIVCLINSLDSVCLKLIEETFVFLHLVDEHCRGDVLGKLGKVDLVIADGRAVDSIDCLAEILIKELAVFTIDKSIDFVLKLFENVDHVVKRDVLHSLVIFVVIGNIEGEKLEKLILNLGADSRGLAGLEIDISYHFRHEGINDNCAALVLHVDMVGYVACYSSDNALIRAESYLNGELGAAEQCINIDEPIKIHFVVCHISDVVEIGDILSDRLEGCGVELAVKDDVAVDREGLELLYEIGDAEFGRLSFDLNDSFLIVCDDAACNVGELHCDLLLNLGICDVGINYLCDHVVDLLVCEILNLGKILELNNTGCNSHSDHVVDVSCEVLDLGFIVCKILEEFLIVSIFRAVVVILNVRSEHVFPYLITAGQRYCAERIGYGSCACVPIALDLICYLLENEGFSGVDHSVENCLQL